MKANKKATKKTRIPSLRCDKKRGFVELNGQRIYLGAWGEPETQSAYESTIAEWLSNKKVSQVPVDVITINEVCQDYWLHCQEYFLMPNGELSSSIEILRQALKPLVSMYGHTKADDFGPLALRGIRETWIDKELSRETINKYTSSIKRMFKYAASHEKVDIRVYQSISTVDNLKAGRSRAIESEAVRPVPESHIYAIKEFVSSQVWALIELQLLTGTRAGELLKLRACDLNVSDSVWTASLDEHKMSYKGNKRTIYFGPKAQVILKAFMRSRGVQEALFSPRDAEQERYSQSETHHRINQKKNLTSSDRVVGEFYTTGSYRRAITRACDKAGVPAWTPHRLRHNAATFIRKNYSLDAAQVVLGHSNLRVTELYAERDGALAEKVIGEIG